MDFSYVVFSIIVILFTIAIVITIISIPIAILYLLYRWLKKKGYKKLGVLIISTTAIWAIYSSFTFFYPTESFYEDEFERFTELEYPKDAEILFKRTTYPVLEGEYFSNALFRVDSNDFNDILSKTKSNNDFESYNPNSGESIYYKNKLTMIDFKGFTINYLTFSKRKSGKFLISFDKQNNFIMFYSNRW